MNTRSKDYESLLRDPRWQKRRLEFMSAKGWKCEVCGDDREELHVHHTHYADGRRPWEYDDSWMECLCDTCHTLRHLCRDKVRGYVFKSEHIAERMARIEELEKGARVSDMHIRLLKTKLRERAGA